MLDIFEIYDIVESIPDCDFRSNEFLNDSDLNSESDEKFEHSNDDL